MSKTKSSCFSLIIGLLFIFSGLNAQVQKVNVKISEVRSTKGKIILNVFKDNETFENEKPFKKMEFTKQGLVNGALQLSFNLEPGTYGITLLDDENENHEMDKNIISIPKEGFGFSNFYLDKMKRPVFDEFKIVIKAGENTVAIRTKYM